MRQSLIEFVHGFAAKGSDIALSYRRGYRMERWSFRRLTAEANRFARELESRGVAKGDSVVIFGEASAEWVAGFWGCVLRGAVVVPLDAAFTADFVSRVIREVQGKLLLWSGKVSDAAFSIPTLALETLAESLSHHSAEFYPSPSLSREDTLEIIFTSGTTADPRGVVVSHGNVLANLEPLETEIHKYLHYERLVHPLSFLVSLPLSHVFGQMMGLFVPPLLGGTAILPDSLKPNDLIEFVKRERVSVFVAVPRVMESLQREFERRFAEEGSHGAFQKDFLAAEHEHFLRRWWRFRRIHRALGWKFWAFISGGAALPSEVETFWSRLGYAVIQGYGMTETTSLISLNHPFRPGKGSLGASFPGMEVRVSDEGEVLVRGKNIAANYRKGGALEATSDPEGWFHTGDLAEVGADGRLYFKGRRKNLIVTPAGMKVFPGDLEAALRKQEGVRDCVVIALERGGNAEACAALLLNSGAANPPQIIENANRELTEYQRIRYWFEWPEPDFPRTPTQKPKMALIQKAANQKFGEASQIQSATRGNSLQNMIARITGQPNTHDVKADTVLNLSSLDQMELISALEDRYQVDLSGANFSAARTVGDFEKLLHNHESSAPKHAYPRWPQHWLIRAIRLAVYYSLTWPATYLLAAPRVVGRQNLKGIHGPVLVVSNHVTYIDIGWVLAALPARFRNRLATAMGGERLSAMRNPAAHLSWLRRLGEKLGYFAVVALFNVFPLPQKSGFRHSFSFAGDLVDRGWNILVFPEGVTTDDGRMAEFRAGIGLLAAKLDIPVVPIRLEGVWELKKVGRHFAMPGQVKVAIGKTVRFSSEEGPADIAKELADRVAEL